MSSAATNPQSTSQQRRSLLELSEKLRELADIQLQPQTEDIKSAPEFRALVHRLCQEEPAVAQAIFLAIQEGISDPSACLASKRKRRQDPTYRPSHMVPSTPRKKRCTHNEDLIDEPMTPESGITESESPETRDAPNSIVCVDIAGLGPTPDNESKPDARSSLVAMHEDKAARSETIHCNTKPTTPNRLRTVSPSVAEQDLTEAVSFLDMVHQMVEIVHLLNSYQADLPRPVYQRILHSLHATQEPTTESSTPQWSDGRMWMEILERGSASNRRWSVLNMLEYMGASKWYDTQIQHAKRTVYTTDKKLVGEKGAATHVLDRITREYSLLGRKTIINQCSRGKRLRELVEIVGLGILISPKIWEYTKKREHHFNQLIQELRTDPQQRALYKILTPQVEQLVHEGRTDPEAMYRALTEHNLISDDELQEMKAKLRSRLGSSSTIEQLTSQVSMQLFNKPKLDKDDTISINGSPELSIDILERLRPGEWLDSWALMAAMCISDRPDCVRFGESIPLDSIGRQGRMRPIKQPFQAWVKKIRMFRNEAPGNMPLVFYSPVNHTNSHFTLLEINDKDRAIRHYDSRVPLDTRNGVSKTRVAALVKDEFSDLGYSYTEAPTPQQSDGWSCGTRVIWNFRRLSNGLEIGSWDTVLSSESMSMEIISGLMACLESNAMQKYSRSKQKHGI